MFGREEAIGDRKIYMARACYSSVCRAKFPILKLTIFPPIKNSIPLFVFLHAKNWLFGHKTPKLIQDWINQRSSRFGTVPWLFGGYCWRYGWYWFSAGMILQWLFFSCGGNCCLGNLVMMGNVHHTGTTWGSLVNWIDALPRAIPAKAQ